jgi:hypothetical protein
MKRNNKIILAEAAVRYAKHAEKLGLTILTEYQGNKIPLRVRHVCGREYQIYPYSIRVGFGCASCVQKLSETELSARFAKYTKRGISVIGEYQGAKFPLRVRHSCGHEWDARMPNLEKGYGCPKCANWFPLSDAELAKRSIKYADELGINILGKYKNSHSPILVRHSCGFEWNSSITNLEKGVGCRKCARYGFQPNKPAIAYYVRFDLAEGVFYKIGVTNRTVAERFVAHRTKPNVLKIFSFDTGSEALEFEEKVLRENAFEQYRGTDILLNGNNELFVSDVLGLDHVDDAQLLIELAA